MVKSSRIRHSALVLAAAILVTLPFTGCDSSQSQATTSAKTTSAVAARLAAGAGEVKAKDELLAKLDSNDLSLMQKAGDDVKSEIAADKENKRGVWKKYLEQKSALVDLDAVADKLTAVLDADLNNDAIKSSIQVQLGQTQARQARLAIALAQQKMTDLIDRASNFQASAAYANELGAEAAVLDTAAKGDAPVDLDKLQLSIDDKKKTVADAQTALDGLKKDAADKQAKAADIYSATEAAFQKADSLSGKEAIDASQKAVDDRKAADELATDVMNLQPKISAAQSALTIAQVQQAEAESLLASAKSGVAQNGQRIKSAAEEAATLRDQAKKIIEGETGIAKAYGSFKEVLDAVKVDIDKATKYAAKADKSFGDSINTLGTYASSFDDRNLAVDNPLNKVIKTPENKALLQLFQASAKEQRGRAALLAYTVSNIQAAAAQALETAYKGAGMTQDAGAAKASQDATASKDTAVAQFEAASSMAQSVASSARETAPTKWLGFTLQAIALHGKYIITGQNLGEASAAAKSATSFNPFLNLAFLTNAEAETPASIPAAH